MNSTRRASGHRPVQRRDYFALSFVVFVSLSAYAPAARAEDPDLAKQLSNPVASLISVPFQGNYDAGIGPADGKRYFVNVQPVIPFDLGQDWNLISRTIVPVIPQSDVAGRSGTQTGIGDTTQSLFLSPKAKGPGGLIGGRAAAERSLDGRRPRQPRLVLRRAGRPRPHQHDLRAALPLLHHGQGLDVRLQHREHLRLEGG